MRTPLPQAPEAPPGSLAAALASVPDPRKPYGWRPEYPPIPLVGLLQLTVAALLSGARSLAAVAQWGRERREDEPGLLVALGLAPGRSPCVATLHRVFKALDVAAFERAVGTWLAQTGVEPTESVAVDGKTLRGVHGEGLPGEHLVSAYAHQAGVVLAQLRSAGQGHEIAATAQVVAAVALSGRVVTADALLTQRELSQQIVAGGGDYLLPVKENQPALLADLQAVFSPLGSGTGAGRRRRTDRATVAGRRAGSARWAVGSGGGPGAEGAPRPPRGPPAVGAFRSGGQRLCRQQW